MSTEPKWTVSCYPKNITERETRSGDELIKADFATNSQRKAVYEYRLCYEGKLAHVLTGDRAKQILEDFAAELNAQNYEPRFEKGKLYMDLTSSQKERLAYLHSPELNFQDS